MNGLEKYSDHHMIEQRLADFETQPESDGQTTANLTAGILRRWYIVPLVFFVMCAIGIPAIWLLIKPIYNVIGAIRVAPILSNLLTGEADRGEISNYQNFMNTQAEMLVSSQVVQRVADHLAKKNLSFFENKAINPAAKLKRAISDDIITAAPANHTELIKVVVKSTNAEEAKQIVDAFISAYMAVEVSSSAQGQDRRLAVLEDERRVLAEKLQRQRETIRQLAQEYGTTALGGRQDMMLQRVASLLAELTKIEARRINLEAQVQLLEQTKEQVIAPEDLLKMRQEYINADPAVETLTVNIVQLDQELIVANQTLASANPELKRKAQLLEALNARLEEQKKHAGKSFDDLMSRELVNAGSRSLIDARNELKQTAAYENRLREILDKEDAETIGLGRKQLTIQDLQFQLELDEDLYDKIRRRIQEMEMEQKRPARISVAYNADVISIRDKRIKYTMALIFGAMALGMLSAFLRDKADLSLHTPDDVVKHIGIRILGTTTSPHTIKEAYLQDQVVGDYQTIRANLGLMDGGGIPNKLVITSAGPGEGKSTLAINLATSLARADKRVLLIDGDLRKPDIANLLNLPKGSRGLQDMLFGKEFDRAVCSIPSIGLDVLAADSRNADDAYDLLALPVVRQQINAAGKKYDHVIIDTPPVLAFPDALLLAKIADAVVLTSFAGQTTAPDLRKARERLAEINVKVLGTVMSNVRAGHSYYRYGYSYYAENVRSRKNAKRAGINLLLPMQSSEDNINGTDSPKEKMN